MVDFERLMLIVIIPHCFNQESSAAATASLCHSHADDDHESRVYKHVKKEGRNVIGVIKNPKHGRRFVQTRVRAQTRDAKDATSIEVEQRAPTDRVQRPIAAAMTSRVTSSYADKRACARDSASRRLDRLISCCPSTRSSSQNG